MIRDIGRFYWQCLRRAFAGKFWFVEKWTGALSLLALLVGFFWPTLSPQQAEFANTYVPAVFFMTVFSATVLFGFVVAPYLLYSEQKQIVATLMDRQKPRLVARVPGTLPFPVRTGATTTSLSGHRQTVIRGQTQTIAIHCENIGLEGSGPCSARLVSVWRQEGAHFIQLDMPETVELTWSRDPKNFVPWDYLDPGERKTIYIAGVNHLGMMWLYRDQGALPLEYHQLLALPGVYQMMLSLKAQDANPVHIHLQVETSAGEMKPGSVQMGSARLMILTQAIAA